MIEYEYKIITRNGKGILWILQEDLDFIQEGSWEILFVDINIATMHYCIQLKRQIEVVSFSNE